MKFCPVVPEICRGQVHGGRKERRITRTRIIIIIINGAKTISLQTLFGRLNNNMKLVDLNEDVRLFILPFILLEVPVLFMLIVNNNNVYAY
jgi:hypothetical protein